MFTLSTEFIQEIRQATESNEISWVNVDGYLCSDTVFKGQKYMICKYPLENSNSFDVSFNKLNAYNNMVRPYLEFSEGDLLYNELIELADLVWEKKNVIAA